MKLKLKNTPEQIELVKAIGSNDYTVSREAQEAFAAFQLSLCLLKSPPITSLSAIR